MWIWHKYFQYSKDNSCKQAFKINGWLTRQYLLEVSEFSTIGPSPCAVVVGLMSYTLESSHRIKLQVPSMLACSTAHTLFVLMSSLSNFPTSLPVLPKSFLKSASRKHQLRQSMRSIEVGRIKKVWKLYVCAKGMELTKNDSYKFKKFSLTGK